MLRAFRFSAVAVVVAGLGQLLDTGAAEEMTQVQKDFTKRTFAGCMGEEKDKWLSGLKPETRAKMEGERLVTFCKCAAVNLTRFLEADSKRDADGVLERLNAAGIKLIVGCTKMAFERHP